MDTIESTGKNLSLHQSMAGRSKYFLPLTYSSATPAAASSEEWTVHAASIGARAARDDSNGTIPDEEVLSLLCDGEVGGRSGGYRSYGTRPNLHTAASYLERYGPTMGAPFMLEEGMTPSSASSSSSFPLLADADRELLEDMNQLATQLAHTRRQKQIQQRKRTSESAKKVNEVNTTAAPRPPPPLLTPIDYSAPPVLEALAETIGQPIHFRRAKEKGQPTTTHTQAGQEEAQMTDVTRAPQSIRKAPAIDLTQVKDVEEAPNRRSAAETDNGRSSWPVRQQDKLVIDDLHRPVSDEEAHIYAMSKRRVLSRMTHTQREQYIAESEAQVKRIQASHPIRKFLKKETDKNLTATHTESTMRVTQHQTQSRPASSAQAIPSSMIAEELSSDSSTSDEDDFLAELQSASAGPLPQWRSKGLIALPRARRGGGRSSAPSTTSRKSTQSQSRRGRKPTATTSGSRPALAKKGTESRKPSSERGVMRIRQAASDEDATEDEADVLLQSTNSPNPGEIVDRDEIYPGSGYFAFHADDPTHRPPPDIVQQAEKLRKLQADRREAYQSEEESTE